MPIKVENTRHFELTQYMRSLVSKLPSGSSFPTMLELQESLGASQATIAKALSEMRREGLIFRPPNKKKYVVSERTGTPLLRFALLRSSYPSIDYDALSNSLLTAVSGSGGSLSILYLEAMSSQSFRSVIDGYDGIALLPSSKPLPGFILDYVHNPERPLVALQQKIEGSPASFVLLDEKAIGRKATSCLAGLGHKRIAVVVDQPRGYATQERVAGWRQAMKEAGLEDSGSLIVDCQVQPGENALNVSYARLKELLKKGLPDFSAAFCVSMCGGIALARACSETGIKIPDDLSVLPFSGESDMAPFIVPKLSSLEFDLAAFGRKAVDFLKEKSRSKIWMIEPYLEIRDSTAAPAAERRRAS